MLVSFVPEPLHVHKHHHQSFVEGLKGLFKNEYFMRLLGAYALTNMGNGVPATLLLYFSRDYVHAGEETQRLFLLIYFLCGVLSTPLWLWLSHKTSKHRAWCFAMLVACAGFIWTPLVGYAWLGSWSPVGFGIIMAVAGMSVGADLMLPVSIQADVIDVDTARTGEQHTGFYFASWALANKIALSVALGFGFVILGLVGFNGTDHPKAAVSEVASPAAAVSAAATAVAPAVTSANPTTEQPARPASSATDAPVPQTPLALWTLVFLYCVVPILLKLGAVKLVWNFPIGANEQAKLREAIEAQLLKDA
jgi:Na+/melibiose symporter-like transporter